MSVLTHSTLLTCDFVVYVIVKMIKKKDTRGTIRPPKVLLDYINEYLKSDEAKQLGFTTPSSFVEHLVRMFVQNNIHSPNIMELNPKLVKYDIKTDEIIFTTDSLSFSLIVQHTSKKENILICTRCNNPDCVYRNFVLEQRDFWDFLRDHNVSIKRQRKSKIRKLSSDR